MTADHEAPGVPGADRAAREVPAQPGSPEDVRAPGVLKQILGRDQDDDDRPLPDLPPLPDDPTWRIEHLPMITAIGVALTLCAGSAAFLLAGVTAGLGVAAGVFIVAIGFSLSTLAIAWADAVRPALVMPVGLTVYVIKYALIVLILFSAGGSGWPGARAMAYGIAIGAVSMTAVQVWWVTRMANRRLSGAP
jgi:hypothetical protein